MHEPPYMWALSFFLRRNGSIALCSMAACLGCFAVCSLSPSVFGEEDPSSLSVLAVGFSGWGFVLHVQHQAQEGVGFTWKPRVSLLHKLLVEIKASLFFGLFCLAAFSWWYSDTRRKKPLSTVSWICLCRRMWHCVYPVSVLCGHYTGRHLFSLSCPTYCWNSVMLIHQRHFSDPLNCTGLLWSKRD